MYVRVRVMFSNAKQKLDKEYLKPHNISPTKWDQCFILFEGVLKRKDKEAMRS